MNRTHKQQNGHTGPDPILVLFTGNLEQAGVIPLSITQFGIVTRSIFKNNTPDSPAYTDSELLRCTDADRAFRKPLLSIRQAGTLLTGHNISAAAIFLNPDTPYERCLPLTFTQAAVMVGRLGIDLDKNQCLSDEVLSTLYKETWKPRFKAAPAVAPPAPQALRNLRAGLLSPSKIKAGLDRTIIGQEQAKQKLATAVYQQALAQRYNSAHAHDADFVPMRRRNLLLCGPSGSGKTAMIKKLADILDRPVVIYDATTLTPAGYVGNSPSDVLKELLNKADGDPAKAAAGIVYLDEWDKAFAGANQTKEVARFKSTACSYELLRMMDGTIVTFDTMTGPLTLDTANILFIMGGAFPGLDAIIQQRTEEAQQQSGPAIGFMAEPEIQRSPCDNAPLPDPTPEDLKRYEIPAEVLGRISTIIRLKELDSADLVNILVSSDQSPLAEYRKLFTLHHITLEVPDTALRAMADMAVTRKLGARGLTSILESVLSPVLFRYAENKKQLVLRLTPDCFTCGAEPKCRPFRTPVRRIQPPF